MLFCESQKQGFPGNCSFYIMEEEIHAILFRFLAACNYILKLCGPNKKKEPGDAMTQTFYKRNVPRFSSKFSLLENIICVMRTFH